MDHTFSSLKTETTKSHTNVARTLLSFLHPRNKKPSHSSFEKTSQRVFGQQENENEREGKIEQGSVYSIY